MEKVKIIKCESIMNGKAHGVTFVDEIGGIKKATAWNDKVNSGDLMQAYATGQEIQLEVAHYTSKVGKTGLNIVAIGQQKGQMLLPSLPYPITDSEKVIQNAAEESEHTKPKANLMSQKDIMIISQCLTKCVAQMSQTSTMSPSDRPGFVLEAYRFFVLDLEQNG